MRLLRLSLFVLSVVRCLSLLFTSRLDARKFPMANSFRSISQLKMGRASGFKTGREESKRQARVSQLLISELAAIIGEGHQVKGAKMIDDNVRSKISIVEVNVSPDLRHARIFVSIYGDTFQKREAYGWCVKNVGGIRYALSQRLKNMKGVPQLSFQQTDVSAAVDVMHLIEQVNSNNKDDGNIGIVGGLDFDDEDDFDFDEMDDDEIDDNEYDSDLESDVDSE